MVTPVLVGAETTITEEPLVTATFFDSDLKESLKEISLQTGVAIICDDNVRGLITMDLKNVPLEKAIRMMVSGGGFMYRKMGDYYIVGLPDPRNPTFALLCETEIFYFKNISPESARSLLPTVYSSYVRIDPEKNMATINAPASIMGQIITDLEKIDGARAQVKIKALLTEIQKEAITQLGTNLIKHSSNPGSVNREYTLDTLTGLFTLEERTSFGSLKAILSVLSQEKKASIQADPEITVVEGKTGQLFVGEKETLILKAESSLNSYNTDTQTVDAGITLKVTPKVFKDHIELNVTQLVSGIEEREEDRILVKTREFGSVIRIAPGQTVMVAGLTETRAKSEINKTPLLGDIPLVRFFFRNKSNQKSDSQLVLFLTAEVVK